MNFFYWTELCWLANFNLFCILYRKIYDLDRVLCVFLLQLLTLTSFQNYLNKGINTGLPFCKQTPQLLLQFFFQMMRIMEANLVLFYMCLLGSYSVIFGEWGKVSLNLLVNWGLTIYAYSCKNTPWQMVFSGNILEVHRIWIFLIKLQN